MQTMQELTLKSHRFRKEREAEWRRLEDLLARAEASSASALSDDEIIALPVLYRSALSSLSVARAISLDQSLIAYLESLCTRAYFFVYGTRTTFAKRIVAFFQRDWPRAAQDLWLETVIAVALTALGAAVAYVLFMRDSTWFYSFVSPALAGDRGPAAATEELRATLFSEDQSGLSIFATFLFTHNAQVALFAFALGFAFCLPAAFLVLTNGMMLGAFVALFVSRGLGIEFGGWLSIHGTTELFAIALSGAAGFRLGWTLAFPGQRSRVDAMSVAGRKAAIVMTGVVVMLGVAGALEGIGRQVVTDTSLRYAIAAFAILFWLFYLYLPREEEDDEHG
jgi:uncharacterized membrane protein SpoIIM required for sporulation